MDPIISTTGTAAARMGTKQAFKLWRRKKPIRITAETIVGDEWAVTLPSEGLMDDFPSQPGYGKDIHDLLIGRGAADHQYTDVRLRLENIAQETVDVRNIRAVKTVEDTPHHTTRMYHPTAGESAIPFLRYQLNERAPAAVQMEYDYESATWTEHKAPYFANKRISLQPKETFEFYIRGVAEDLYCEWHLEVDFIIASKTGYLEADNDGIPFRTSGTPADGFSSDWLWVWWEIDPKDQGFRLASEINP